MYFQNHESLQKHTHKHAHTHMAGLEDAQKVLKRETCESVWLFLPRSAETVALQEASRHQHIHGKHRVTSFFLWVSHPASSSLCIYPVPHFCDNITI